MTTAYLVSSSTSIQDLDHEEDRFANVIRSADEGNTFADTEEILFEDLALRIFSSGGPTQRQYREELLALLPFLGNHDSKLDRILELVERIGSQEAIVAGIDLMTGFGEVVVDRACKVAFRSDIAANSGFALAAAATRAKRNVAGWIIESSEHPAILEAVLEFLDDEPTEEAIPLIRRILTRDRIPESVKKMAERRLADLQNVSIAR